MSYELRPYQKESIDALWEWWRKNKTGNPLLVWPTGAGKSIGIAEVCRRIQAAKPHYKILILSHRKEIIKQNAEKISQATGSSCGIYSASLGIKRFRTITCGQIQSLYRKSLEEMQLIIIDECHLLSNDANSMYKKLLDKQGGAKVLGLTATPYRMDQGSLLAEGSIFTDICYDISIPELIRDGYLSSITSKSGVAINTEGVKKSGGDFNQSELAERVKTLEDQHAREIISAARDRHHWLIFCVGIEHAKRVAGSLKVLGVASEYITGEMLPMQRDQIIERFRNKITKALVNVDVLTTGFDFPTIDLLAIIRPTQSIGLYVQMVGRGMRIAEGKTNCLLLDFGENIQRHGPIDCIKVRAKTKHDKIELEMLPMKECRKCGVTIAANYRTCPECGEMLTRLNKEPERVAEVLSVPELWPINNVHYKIHTKNEKRSLRIDYRSGLRQVSEFLCLEHGGQATAMARRKWCKLSGKNDFPSNVDFAFNRAGELPIPAEIEVTRDGKYYKLLRITKVKEEIELEAGEPNI